METNVWYFSRKPHGCSLHSHNFLSGSCLTISSFPSFFFILRRFLFYFLFAERASAAGQRIAQGPRASGWMAEEKQTPSSVSAGHLWLHSLGHVSREGSTGAHGRGHPESVAVICCLVYFIIDLSLNSTQQWRNVRQIKQFNKLILTVFITRPTHPETCG